VQNLKKQVHFNLNGKTVTALVSPKETLLDVLRSQYQLYGARESCALGLCGTCTVMVSGTPVSSCLYFAPAVDGEEVLTIEGLGNMDQLHPVQEAFHSKQGFQCGYCTPGMIMMTAKLLEENPHPTEEKIKDFMVGNICRCGSYVQIIEAIQEASKLMALYSTGERSSKDM
jgi:aerobic-type carbon monoxide dehydrogenase small subunit (CoxS/CutS family)